MDRENDIFNYLSLKILRFFLRFLGICPTNNSHDRLIFTLTNLSIITVIFVGLLMSLTDLYHSLDDLQKLSCGLRISVTIGIEMIKLSKTFIDRNKFFNFNTYTQRTFWTKSYNSMEIEILKNCDRKSIRLVLAHMFFTTISGILYVFIPYYESIGKNSSDRVLPFTIYFDLPILETPYYQLAFITQAVSTMCLAVCTATCSGFLSITNFYAAGQFRILQNKFQISINNVKCNQDNDTVTKRTISLSSLNIKNCVEEHQKLILYMKKVEDLFNVIIFAQTFGSVLLLCFCSFQLLLSVDTSILRCVLSVQYLVGSLVQLFLFAWPCQEIIVESMGVAEAAYRACWYHLPYTREAMSSRKSLLIVIIRARKPCVLTVGKFTPMSLQTFSSVINTALSYFAVLRQMKEDAN